MISLEKWMILTPFQKLPNNVGNLDKIIVATGFEWLPKVQKSPNLITLMTTHQSAPAGERWIFIRKFGMHFLTERKPERVSYGDGKNNSIRKGRRAVCPDVGVKSSPNISKSYPRSSHISLYRRVRFFKRPKKLLLIWATFARNIVTKNFQKLPNLVTLKTSQKLQTTFLSQKAIP